MEEWRPIKSYEGHYEVSNMGRVRSIKNTGYGSPSRPVIMKPASQGKSRHQRVSLCLNGFSKSYLVHRLVANEFIKPISKKDIVCHKDDDGTNNSVSNLYIGTHSSNWYDALKNGNRSLPKGESNANHKLSESDVITIRSLRGKKKQIDIAKMFNVTQVCISKIHLGKTWSHLNANE